MLHGMPNHNLDATLLRAAWYRGRCGRGQVTNTRWSLAILPRYTEKATRLHAKKPLHLVSCCFDVQVPAVLCNPPGHILVGIRSQRKVKHRHGLVERLSNEHGLHPLYSIGPLFVDVGQCLLEVLCGSNFSECLEQLLGLAEIHRPVPGRRLGPRSATRLFADGRCSCHILLLSGADIAGCICEAASVVDLLDGSSLCSCRSLFQSTGSVSKEVSWLELQLPLDLL
mmetsp:Transcript_28493/g.50941  ORF Transcript_28493/g.50941 Transcript_28493/m.50941 type:complete len:226 (-) Transcript_28493:171-848(-)